MTQLINPKVQATGLMDVIGLAIAKSMTERLLTPVIGNATMTSGAVKLVGGTVAHGKLGKFGNMISGGMVVDGVEDLVKALLPAQLGGGVSSQAQDEWA